MSDPISIRLPSVVASIKADSFKPPSTAWLEGTWHVTHSTLPMWKSKRNVKITYTPIGDSSSLASAASSPRIDDVVQYQTLTSDKIQRIHGIDTPSSGVDGAWDWRGKGWLMIASSHWEILGYGSHGDEDWVVTYFAKTLFTPAGMDIYSRKKGTVSDDLLNQIKGAMGKMEDDGLKNLIAGLFKVKHDDV